jgi:diguanylate cyclase (GGDEF)-like protein/PAS domain S-box-containing protein
MAHPLPNEEALYEQLRCDCITVAPGLWEFLCRRIAEDITAISLICQESISAVKPVSVLETRQILLCTHDIENIMHTVAADSKEEIIFKQFKGNIPLHPVIRELFVHQISNDVYAINTIAGDYSDPLDPRPIPAEDVRKILSHTEAISAFLEGLNKKTALTSGDAAKGGSDLYRLLYDSFSDGLVRFDRHGGVVECNQAFLQLMGYTRDELRALNINELCPHSGNTDTDDVVNALIFASGQGKNFERDCVRKDGNIFAAAVRMWPIFDAKHKPVGMWTIVRDISATRKEQRAILREVWATQTVIEKIGEGITLSDAAGRFEIFNSRMTELTGYTIDEVNKSGDFNSLIYPDPAERNKTLAGINQVIEQRGYHEAESTVRAKDGTSRNVLVTTSLIRYRDRDMFLSVWRDITAQRQAEAALRRQEEFIRRLIQGSSAPTFVLDRTHKVIFWNTACEALTKVQASEVIETTDAWKGFYLYKRPCLADLILDGSGPDMSEYYSVSRPSDFLFSGRHAEDWLTMRDGKERYMLFDAVPVLDAAGATVAVIETLFDDTQNKMAQRERLLLNAELIKSNDKLKELALKDPHTALYNFRYLESAIESEYERSKRQAQSLSVMMIDLDYFKSINDVYGHQFGDYILKLVAIRLRRTVRTYDIVIRYGGEEFVIICPGSDRQDATHLGQRILEEFNSRTLGNDEYAVRIKLSIGIASFPEDSASKGMALVDLADRILNRVKESGGNKVFSSTDAFYAAEHLFYDTNDVQSIKAKIERVNKRVNCIVAEELLAFARNSAVRDRYSPAQMEERASLAVKIGQGLHMPPYALELISEAAMMHDLGKLGLQEETLLKTDPLTDSEWVLVKQHPQIAADIIYAIPSLRPIIPAVLNHHEHWDGTGYPSGLKAEEIPREASIIGLVDSYSAMVSDRPYRKALSQKEAYSVITEGSGTKFCPAVVENFKKIVVPR